MRPQKGITNHLFFVAALASARQHIRQATNAIEAGACLSQAAVARRVGVSRSTLARWERGELIPPLDKFLLWVDAVGADCVVGSFNGGTFARTCQRGVYDALAEGHDPLPYTITGEAPADYPWWRTDYVPPRIPYVESERARMAREAREDAVIPFNPTTLEVGNEH